MNASNLNLFSKIRYYLQISQEFKTHLSKFPHEWNKFQKIFDLSVDKVHQDIREFEKENIDKSEERVYRLKKIFERRYRHYFLYGDFIKWSFKKPFGYAGDFKIIDDIYRNNPSTSGFDRLWDNYFQKLAATESIRKRKEDLKRIIINFVKERKEKNIRIMNLASGPAREIKETIETDPDMVLSRVNFDCYDFDAKAIDYAKQLLNSVDNVNFYQRNAIRLALKKDIKSEICCEYDLIYSSGLFDYLDDRVATRLVGNLKKLLKKNGLMVIANAGDKEDNSSASWMEWVAEWYLIYRSKDEFRKIFLDAGFLSNELQIILQDSKIVQYCLAETR